MGRVRKMRRLAMGSMAGFVFALLGLVLVQVNNNSLTQRLDQERLKSEALLSEKLSIQKSAIKTHQQLSSLNRKRNDLDRQLEELKKQSKKSERRKRQLQTLLEKVELKLSSQSALQTSLRLDLEGLRLSNAQKTKSNTNLHDSIRVLIRENQIVLGDLNRSRLSIFDRPLIKSLKGKKNKATTKAGSTKEIVATVDVPEGLNDLTFDLYAPDGSQLDSKAGTIVSNILPNDKLYMASADSKLIFHKMQRIEITYARKEKLKPGTYSLMIMNNHLYIGSIQIDLR